MDQFVNCRAIFIAHNGQSGTHSFGQGQGETFKSTGKNKDLRTGKWGQDLISETAKLDLLCKAVTFDQSQTILVVFFIVMLFAPEFYFPIR